MKLCRDRYFSFRGVRIPIFEDSGELFVPSKTCAVAVGYAQSDTIYRLITESDHKDFQEGEHYQLRSVKGFRSQHKNALMPKYSETVSLFSRQKNPVLLLNVRWIQNLNSKTKNHRIPQLSSQLYEYCFAKEDSSSEDTLEKAAESFLASTSKDLRIPRSEKSLSNDTEWLDEILDDAREKREEVIRNFNKDLFPPEEDCNPVFENTESRIEAIEGELEDLIRNQDIGGYKLPENFEEEFDVATGDWTLEFYKAVIEHHRIKPSISPNIPNLPLILPNLCQTLGLLSPQMKPTKKGAHFLFLKGDTLYYRIKPMLNLLYIFVVHNKSVDYQKFLSLPFEMMSHTNLSAIHAYLQKELEYYEHPDSFAIKPQVHVKRFL